MPINILLAEDDAAHIEIVRRKLKDFPVANRFFLAKDGQEALDFLFRKGACAYWLVWNRFPGHDV